MTALPEMSDEDLKDLFDNPKLDSTAKAELLKPQQSPATGAAADEDDFSEYFTEEAWEKFYQDMEREQAELLAARSQALEATFAAKDQVPGWQREPEEPENYDEVQANERERGAEADLAAFEKQFDQQQGATPSATEKFAAYDKAAEVTQRRGRSM